MEYIIIKGDKYGGMDDLESFVNEKIKQGFIPLGGVCCFKHQNNLEPHFAQAMIRKDTPDE